MVFSVSLDSNDSLVTALNAQRGASGSSTQLQTEYDRLPLSELGWGWDVRAAYGESGEGGSIGGGFSYQGALASATAQVDGNLSSVRYQLDLSGSVGELAGVGFLTRRIFDSFGVARVADVPNVPVYVENQLAGHTDAQGRVFLPRLIAYTDNKVSIDVDDLPFDAETVGGDSVSVAPYYRSGVVIDLPVRRFRSALITLVQPDGSPVPAGAHVSYPRSGPDVYVAERGQVYVRDVLEHDNQLQVDWEGHRCHAHFDLPSGNRVQPKVGPLTCLEDAP
jgi:outer membrane usher protein